MKNIILVSLIESNAKKIGLSLANKLDFFYLNVEELVDYKLLNKEEMKEVCGIKYATLQESNLIKGLSNYERTVMSMQYETFSENISNILTNNVIVYLQYDKNSIQKEIKKMQINKILKPGAKEFKISQLEMTEIVFEERDKFLKRNSKFTIDCSTNNISNSVKIILENLKNDYND